MNKKIIRLSLCLILFIFFILLDYNCLVVNAKEPGCDFVRAKITKEEGSNHGIVCAAGTYDFLEWDGTKNDSIEEINNHLKVIGGSYFGLLKIIDIILFIVAVIFVGLNIASGKRQNVEDGKNWLGKITIAVICLFSLTSILTVLQSIGRAI